MPTRQQITQDALLAISLANLSYLRSWAELNIIRERAQYFLPHAAGSVLELSTLTSVILLGTLLFFLFYLLRRFGRRAGVIAIDALACMLLVYLAVRILASFQSIREVCAPALGLFLAAGTTALLVGSALLILTFLFLIASRPQQVIRFSRYAALVMSPFFVLCAAGALRSLAVRPSQRSFADRSPAQLPARTTAPRGRFIWMIFDELDQDMLSEARPEGLELKEFDSFRRRSFSAEKTVAAGTATLVALPSLTLGRIVTAATPVGPGRLALRFADGRSGDWGSEENAFQKAAKLGLRSALAGWYHPYCRVLGSSLNACYARVEPAWENGAMWADFADATGLWRLLPVQAALEFQAGRSLDDLSSPVSGPPGLEFAKHARETHVEEYQDLRQKALEFVADTSNDLVLIHVPLPHLPGIYDREKGALSAAPGLGYFDNLKLADVFLGEVRHTLEQTGTWAGAAVLVTSDHPYRQRLWSHLGLSNPETDRQAAGRPLNRIPFLLKLPGQTAELSYTSELHAVLTRDLLLALMRGELKTYEEVAAWFDRHHEVSMAAAR